MQGTKKTHDSKTFALSPLVLVDSTPKTKTTDTMVTVTVTKMKTSPWDMDDSNEDSEEGKRNNILQKAILLYIGKVRKLSSLCNFRARPPYAIFGYLK